MLFRSTAIKTAKVLGLEIAGIDLLFDTHGFRVCEANSNPGFSGFEKYCHTDVADNITDYIINKLLKTQKVLNLVKHLLIYIAYLIRHKCHKHLKNCCK